MTDTSNTNPKDHIVAGHNMETTPVSHTDLRERIVAANTIAALDELRIYVVACKDRELLKLWQEKFWERKKKYTFSEVQALITQQVTAARETLLDELEAELRPEGIVMQGNMMMYKCTVEMMLSDKHTKAQPPLADKEQNV